MPHADTQAMTLHLAEVSQAVAPGAHGLVVLDGAGWHQMGGRLRMPGTISLLHLPPYSPEPNPVETVWEYLRSNRLSNRVFGTYDDIVDRCCTAWNWLIDAPDRIRSIATRSWARPVNAYYGWCHTQDDALWPARKISPRSRIGIHNIFIPAGWPADIGYGTIAFDI